MAGRLMPVRSPIMYRFGDSEILQSQMEESLCVTVDHNFWTGGHSQMAWKYVSGVF